MKIKKMTDFNDI